MSTKCVHDSINKNHEHLEIFSPIESINILVTLAVSCVSAASLVSSLVSTMSQSSLVSTITATRAAPRLPCGIQGKNSSLGGGSFSPGISSLNYWQGERSHLSPPQNLS